ncbi:MULTISPECIES: Na+/H+ antiporter NhaA [Clostridium]|jgi:Na+:H+ antiporter, NhaA family|uniref:Na+/H+ antiporter NhaA n=1 Tax=Clostridium TaxID=1485 RepID=UPI00019B027E|nr:MULTISPECIES: Na+/H+ antiporter NhaA [Clostridium]EEH97900.1 Na+/H+ antiporter NhaA [Clostridium sp. 7_2_43FAA]MBU6135435.1 Na+/H+ antiporter NhaA [Clostridium tertium]MDB1934941.1 Na+/H+ antiporter NhaA [Clostridium tertium]MDB1938827.1 Na+/H+ antiporter NhaA [Clostridium tertium]MDB1969133.1 Na+/H+ antiporter NhaA [Clostridium tertium]
MYYTQEKRNYLSKLKVLLEWEALPGLLLLIATVFALIIANSPLKELYNTIFHHIEIFPNFNLHKFINDFLMAIFFLVVGCEIKMEVIRGHLSDAKRASFPIVAAIGGVTIPAIIFFIFNRSTSYVNGIGVPISTDIAFAVGAFMIFKNRLSNSLKIFLLTLAVVDDLISIAVIGIFYSSGIKIIPLVLGAVTFIMLLSLRKIDKKERLTPYFILGFILWICIFASGIHATISGVLLAITLPISKCNKDTLECTLIRIEHVLAPYANLIILPLFAFSNTAINMNISSIPQGSIKVALGIIVGLVVGKPLGIMLFTSVLSKFKVIEKPKDVKWYDIMCVGMLAGIGFTMSIFVAEIAFTGNENVLNIVKISILLAAIITCLIASIAINLGKKTNNGLNVKEVNA